PATPAFGTPEYNAACGIDLSVTFPDEALAVSGNQASKTKRTWTATDAHNNSATCTQTITVTDNTAPVVTCPANSSAPSDANCQSAVPNVLSGVTVSGGCAGAVSITLSQSPAAGTLVGLGAHTITATATDAHDNTATCTQTFTVKGNAAPVVSCPAKTSASGDANCQAAMPNVLSGVTVSGGCAGAGSITLSQSPL